jgi:hypothetical protein
MDIFDTEVMIKRTLAEILHRFITIDTPSALNPTENDPDSDQ